MDLDHFKRVNDDYGHAVGDAVLRIFADRARALVRKIDIFVRRGGEEFNLIMPSTTQEQARATADRIRTAMAEAALDVGDGIVLTQTVSIGVATWNGEETPQGLQQQADAAMYRAKSWDATSSWSPVRTRGPSPGYDDSRSERRDDTWLERRAVRPSREKASATRMARRASLERRAVRPQGEASAARTRRELRGLFVRRVLRPRPEEPSEPVLFPSRDHVHVEVGHALAHGVVHRHERSVRLETACHGPRHALHALEESAQALGRHVQQGDPVRSGDNQHVPLEDGPRVEKRDRLIVLQHPMDGAARYDVAKTQLMHSPSRRRAAALPSRRCHQVLSC